jgi:hypothetical protein
MPLCHGWGAFRAFRSEQEPEAIRQSKAIVSSIRRPNQRQLVRAAQAEDNAFAIVCRDAFLGADAAHFVHSIEHGQKKSAGLIGS